MKRTISLGLILFWALGSFAQLPIPGGAFLPTSFIPKFQLKTGIYPHSVVAADLNGDGKTDLFVARGSSNANVILPNNSTPGVLSFGTPVVLVSAASDEEGAAAGDLDGDGKTDLVVTNGVTAASVSIYENIGSFAFHRIDLPVVNGPYDVTIGDLDGDGKPDIVVGNDGANVVSFYRNTSTPGNFSFASRIDITVGTNPYSVAIGDLDGDGKPDLAVSCQGTIPGTGLYVLQNTSTVGALSFGTPLQLTSQGGFNPWIHDLDGDGLPDVGVATGSGIEVLRNMSTPGNFSFGPEVIFAPTYVYYTVLTDLDGDGKPDMAAATAAGAIALHNTSTPGTISFQQPVSYSGGFDPRYLAAGDVDGDGLTDLFLANTGDSAISILRNQIGANTAPVFYSYSPASGNSGTQVQIKGLHFTGATAVTFGGVAAASLTVNTDTTITATVGAGASGDIDVTTPYGTVGQSGYSFTGPLLSSFIPTTGNIGTVIKLKGVNFTDATAVTFGGVPAASFTVDSAKGITAVVGAGATGNVVVTTPLGTATLTGFSFSVPVVASVLPTSGPIGSTVVISGANFSPVAANDNVYFGAVRAAVTSATTNHLVVTVPVGATYERISVEVQGLMAYSSKPFLVTFSVQNSTLTAGSFAAAGNYRVGSWPRDVAVRDLDGDGKIDIVVANATSNSISILRNLSSVGSVSLASKIDLATGIDPQRLAIGDIDGDGRPDIISLDFNSGNTSDVTIFRNTSTPGNLSFINDTSFVTGQGSTDLSIMDINGDGRPDIVVACGNSFNVPVFQNMTTSPGNIHFVANGTYYAGYHPSNLTFADLNNDGWPDLAVTDFGGNNVYVFRNKADGTGLATQPAYPVGMYPTFVVPADLDGDGLTDLAVANYGSHTVSFYQNNSTGSTIALGAVQGLNQWVTTMNFADLNGDGKVDLTTGKNLTGKLSFYQNISTGPGNVSFADSILLSSGSYDTYTAVADIDGDGKPDLLAANTEESTVTVFLNLLGEPLITGFTPDSAFKGDTVTITGDNLTGASAVTFGGVSADTFWVVNSNMIKARVGAGASGSVQVNVGVNGVASGGFAFIPQAHADGPLQLCQGGMVLLTSTAAHNNQWYKDGVALSGDTTVSLSATSSGNYTVSTTSDHVTTSSATGVQVSIITVATPVITRNTSGDLVSSDLSSDSISNQWFLNGTAIAGATATTYQPDATGSYTVQSTIGGCSSAVSAPFVIDALKGQIDLGNGQYVSLAPNPVSNSLTIYWDINGSPNLDAVITDPQGRVMKTLINIPDGSVVDMTGLPKGVYYVKIYTAGQLKINKTIKVLKVE